MENFFNEINDVYLKDILINENPYPSYKELFELIKEYIGEIHNFRKHEKWKNNLKKIEIITKKEVLNSKTIWLCAACYTCTERCPRDINITKIMEALRQIILRKNIDYTDLRNISKEEREAIPQLAFVCLFRKNVG